MWRLCALALALVFGAGCVTEADRKQWDEAMKDLRGDNMKMRSLTGTPDHPAPAQPHD